ncbi:MAG TPA: ester cyclase [Candidatus Sulfomarinibacteraceae bacterium]|nr:ester cyclase [Candidatus Sulfomarinibacteraceae bacterium]
MTSDSGASHRQANKAVVRRLFEQAWNEGNVDAVTQELAPEIHFHFRGHSRQTNAEDLRMLVTGWRRSFPDLHFQLHEIIAEGDLVAARLTMTGTHSAPWKGIEPTGRKIKVSNMWFFRLRDGRIVDVWEEFDEHGLRQQLGAARP